MALNPQLLPKFTEVEVDRKQELRDLVAQMVEAHQMGSTESVQRIAQDIHYTIDQM